jgi:protein involved in polysaccharide export with SLBB domain
MRQKKENHRDCPFPSKRCLSHPQFMKKPTIIPLFALVFASFISAAAQETANVAPIKASIKESTSAPAPARPLTEIYRVGAGDVLDIRLLNSPNNRSTLFTVGESGVIDLPVAGGTISVAGLTPEEIQNVIAAELKRRAVEENAQVSVGVRQYLSHAVAVTGLVVHPGTRFLRREMVPLYVVLAESQLRNDGGRVVIMRDGTPGEARDLSDPATLNLNVQSGDIVTISSRPQEFYYIGGRINYPGQKQFQSGITLLQAILASGGTTSKDSNVEISRDGAGGKLVTIRYNLKQIKSGAVQDPKLAAGDRIEVTH